MTISTPNLALLLPRTTLIGRDFPLAILDTAVLVHVEDRDLATPPGTPDDNTVYIVASSPTGAWSGHATQLAAWQSSMWHFYPPREGWLAHMRDEDLLLMWDTTAWVTVVQQSSRRIVTLTDAATVTPNADTTDVGILLSVSQDTLLVNPTGSPTDCQTLEIRLTSAVVRALTWDTQYRSGADLSLPTATSGGNKSDYLGWSWHAGDHTWDFIAYAKGY